MTAARETVRVGVITNPGSQRNRRGLAEVTRLMAGASNARHAVLEQVGDIPGILADFAAAEVEVVAIAAGDGTVQAVLTEIYGRRPFAQAPLLAVAPRGMTNMIAGDVGLSRGPGRALDALARLLSSDRAGLAAQAQSRRILRVENALNREPQYGMFFGGAGICRAIDACLTKVHPMKLHHDIGVAATLAGLLGGWLLGRGRGEAGGIFYGDRLTVTLDNRPPETLEALVVLATTLDRLILGSRPFWGGDEGRMRFTTIAYPPQRLLRYARRLLYGGKERDLPACYRSRSSDRVALAMDCPFTLDGEMFEPTPGREIILTAADEARFVRL